MSTALSAPLAAAMETARAELVAFGLDWPGQEKWGDDSPVFRRAVAEPALAEFKVAEVVRHLVDRGEAVAIANEYIVSTTAFADLLDRLRAGFAVAPEMAFGEFRELSGLTRKLGIPMLEYLDDRNYTVRRGDVRVAGSALGD